MSDQPQRRTAEDHYYAALDLYAEGHMVPEAEAEANRARILGWKQQLKAAKPSPL